MSMIFVTDLHYGPDIINGITIRGTFAHELHEALIDHAHTEGIQWIVDGGDQSTYTKQTDKHYAQAEKAIQTSATFRGLYSRVIGNHEPNKESLLTTFKRHTHVVKQDALEHTDALVVQPKIKPRKDKPTLYRDPKNAPREALWRATRDNLIVPKHWAPDRILRGYNPKSKSSKLYRYLDNSQHLIATLNAESQRRQSIMTLSGHEHAFSRTITLGFECLVMPSMSQTDRDNDKRPCGLFATIYDGKMFGLSVRFHKLTLPEVGQGHSYRVEEVDQTYMERYAKPIAAVA